MDFHKYIDPKLAPSVKLRQDVERRIIDEIAKALVGKGFILRVFDGEEFVGKRTQDPRLIQDLIMSTDEDQLFVYPPHEAQSIGWVQFVYGNDGHDVASNWTENLSTLIEPIVEKYC